MVKTPGQSKTSVNELIFDIAYLAYWIVRLTEIKWYCYSWHVIIYLVCSRGFLRWHFLEELRISMRWNVWTIEMEALKSQKKYCILWLLYVQKIVKVVVMFFSLSYPTFMNYCRATKLFHSRRIATGSWAVLW